MIRHNGIVINRQEKSITHRGVTWRPARRISLAFRAMEMLLLSGGVTKRQLFFHLYGHLDDGGPLYGPEVFHVHFNNWKPLFAMLQLELRRVKIAGEVFFSLAPTLQAAYANVA